MATRTGIGESRVCCNRKQQSGGGAIGCEVPVATPPEAIADIPLDLEAVLEGNTLSNIPQLDASPTLQRQYVREGSLIQPSIRSSQPADGLPDIPLDLERVQQGKPSPQSSHLRHLPVDDEAWPKPSHKQPIEGSPAQNVSPLQDVRLDVEDILGIKPGRTSGSEPHASRPKGISRSIGRGSVPAASLALAADDLDWHFEEVLEIDSRSPSSQAPRLSFWEPLEADNPAKLSPRGRQAAGGSSGDFGGPAGLHSAPSGQYSGWAQGVGGCDLWGAALHTPASLGARGARLGSEELDEQVNVDLSCATSSDFIPHGRNAAVETSNCRDCTACCAAQALEKLA